MQYSIRELSEIAGVSARTLRYYDEIGLLNPLYVNDAGYRFYGDKEVALLQQILFYRERGFDLKRIKQIIYQNDFDIISALNEHLQELEEQKRHMDALIRSVRQTISSMKGECTMSDKEKFEVFKEKRVKENEEKYGSKIRKKYGDEKMESSNRKLLHMSEEDWNKFKSLESEIKERLTEGVLSGLKPDSEAASDIVKMHKEWLMMTWKEYTEEAHKGMGTMYIADERFRMYYDEDAQGCAQLLKQAIDCWAGRI